MKAHEYIDLVETFSPASFAFVCRAYHLCGNNRKAFFEACIVSKIELMSSGDLYNISQKIPYSDVKVIIMKELLGREE